MDWGRNLHCGEILCAANQQFNSNCCLSAHHCLNDILICGPADLARGDVCSRPAYHFRHDFLAASVHRLRIHQHKNEFTCLTNNKGSYLADQHILCTFLI